MFAPRLQALVDPVPQQVVRRPDHTVHHLRLRNQRWRRCSGNRPHQIVPPLWYLHVSWTFYVDRYTSCLVTFRWRDSFKGKFHLLFLSRLLWTKTIYGFPVFGLVAANLALERDSPTYVAWVHASPQMLGWRLIRSEFGWISLALERFLQRTVKILAHCTLCFQC